MTVLFAMLVLFGSQRSDPLDGIRQAVASGQREAMFALFKNPGDAWYLKEMGARKGFANLRVAIIPSPPGWKEAGPYLVVLHRWNMMEDDHDPVYGTIREPDGRIMLGPEVPEDGSPQSIKRLVADVHIKPASHEVEVNAILSINPGIGGKAPLFRLNDIYTLTSAGGARILTADSGVPEPKEGDVVRAGSLVIPWSTRRIQTLRVTYKARVALRADRMVDRRIVDPDAVESTYCFLTAYWTPTLGRNPHTASIRMVGPEDWTFKSEGIPIPPDGKEWASKASVGPGEKAAAYRNDVPISKPMVVAGRYTIAAELHENGKTFRSYQLEPLNKAGGERVVREMADALAYYEKVLAPFPYPGYDCMEARDYYGVESYSYTLEPSTGYHFASHEMAHTYFGGVTPCTYIHDSWNEGLADYLDSVLYHNNSDRVLQAGLRSIRFPKPLSEMYYEWGDGGASYVRGAYVMKMLEAEIGQEQVIGGLKLMLRERIGRDTRWRDIRQYMERSSGKTLDWFWNQWIMGGVFPKLEIVSAKTVEANGKYAIRATVRQSGTDRPFRIKFALKARSGAKSMDRLVTLTSAEQTFQVEPDFQPTDVAIDVLPYALAVAGPAATVLFGDGKQGAGARGRQ